MDDFQSHLFERLPEQDLDSKETELVHLVHRALREAGDGLLQRVVFAEGRPGEVYLQGFHASVLLDEVAADFARDGYDVVLLSDEMARRGGTRGHQVNGERGGGRRRGRIGLLGAAVDSASEGKGVEGESARRQGMAELRETGGGCAGGVHGDDAATGATGGAAEDVGGEGVLVKGSPVEATGSTRLLLLRGR